ncbi:MAG: hypothetical protein GX603_04370, partial [Chloroflexi bacterium]|nr:hypothetical protein [Chloroflexota bacterium]
ALVRSQILERVAAQDPPLRRVMEEVINFYNPRALTALQILLTKIESSPLNPQQSSILKAMWLTAADQANQLWIWPKAKNRPRQLLRPPQYQEANVWKAFLRSASLWSQPEPEVKLRNWPKRVPPAGGISLFEGRLRELSEAPEPGLVKLVQTSLPRRNQAWWNLSGLWSGWLWGKDGVKTLRNSLLKQRYDWTWHSTALKKVLGQLPALLGQDIPILLLTGELDSLFLMAGTLAAKNAGLQLHSMAIDGNSERLQQVWRIPPSAQLAFSARHPNVSIRDSGKIALAKIGEPTHWLRLFASTLTDQLVLGNLVARPKPEEMLNDIGSEFANALNDSSVFQRFNPGVSADSGLYWLAKPPLDLISLSDRAEDIVVQQLQSKQQVQFSELYATVYAGMGGTLTPSDDLIQVILDSYTVSESLDNETVFRLLPSESAQHRSEDLRDIRSQLEQMADKLNYRWESRADRVLWVDQAGNTVFSFFTTASAQISRILSQNQELPGQKMIALPGSRSNLAAYKLKHDPYLRMLMDENWQLIKFRQIRNLAKNPLLTRALFISQINNDPPEYHTAQLALF